MPNLARLFKRFRAAGTNRRLDLSLTWRVSEDPLKRPLKVIILILLLSAGFYIYICRALSISIVDELMRIS